MKASLTMHLLNPSHCFVFVLLLCLSLSNSSPLSTSQPKTRSNSNCPSVCHCDQSLSALRCNADTTHTFNHIVDFFTSLPFDHVRSLQLHNLTLSDRTSVQLPSSIHHLIVQNCSDPLLCQLWLDSTKWPVRLTKLELQGNRLQSVPRLNASSLKQLDLSQNQIRTLQANQFAWCSALRQLNLSHNQLETVASKAFATLNQLQYLNLAHNHIESIESMQLQTLSSLIELDLSHNRLSSNEQISVEPLLRLHSIALNNVSLAKLPDWLLSAQLLRLTFVGNQMRTISQKDFDRHPLLIELDLSQNQISSIADDAFIENSHLLHLDLSDNRLQSIASIVWPKSLQFLRLAANQLDRLSFNLFESLVNLQFLDLSNNKLLQIDYRSIDSHSILSALTTLDLSSNLLLRKLLLPTAKNVRHLKLNHLPQLQTNLIAQLNAFPLLEALQVAGSPLLAQNLLQNLSQWPQARRLKYLNLASNQITTLDQHVIQQQLSTFTLIDLHNNPFDCDMSLEWLAQEVHMQQQQPSLSRKLPQMLQMHEMRCDRPKRLHNHSITEMISLSASQQPMALRQAHQLIEADSKLSGSQSLTRLQVHQQQANQSPPRYYPLIAYLVVFNAVLVLAALVPCSLVLFLGVAVCGESNSSASSSSFGTSGPFGRLRRFLGNDMLTTERVSYSLRNDQVAIISSEHFDQSLSLTLNASPSSNYN